jgi:hypothetical protein
MNGKGTLTTFPNNRIYKGEWKDDKMNGTFLEKGLTGYPRTYTYVNGVMINK